MKIDTVYIHNCATDEIIIREINEEELVQREIDKANAEAKKQAEVIKQIAKQAILDKLGITEEEAKLLLS